MHLTGLSRARLRSLAIVLGIATSTTPAAGAQTQPPVATPPAATVAGPAQAPAPPAADLAAAAPAPTLAIRAELRGRLEGARHPGFASGREDAYWLGRVRLAATVMPARAIALHAEAQDARVARKQVGSTGAPFSAPFDLRQAYLNLGTTTSPVVARIGRQELAFGEQRLVGHVSWLNAARTFDAARLTVRRTGWSVDAFTASVVRVLDGDFDGSGHGSGFHGAYAATSGLIPGAALEPYVFWRRDRLTPSELGSAGPLSFATVGLRANGRVGGAGLGYDLEVAAQRGSASRDRVRAWGAHARLELPSARGVRLAAEYNYASGDENPADGTRGTFDILYPTPHDKYGLADQIGWRNVHHARIGADVTAAPSWPIRLNYHQWWIASLGDAAYTAGGAVLARAPSGSSSRHIGQELDVQLTRAVTPRLQLAAGYALLVPGAFLDAATPGASAHFPFVMATVVFTESR